MALALYTGTASAQVRVGLQFGPVSFKGLSEPATPADSLVISPYGPAEWRLHLALTKRSWEFGLGVTFADAGMDFHRDFLHFVDGEGLMYVVIEPAVGRDVLRLADQTHIWLEAGPSLHFWKMAGEDPRNRFGGWGAMVLRQRISGAFDTNIRGYADYSPTFLQSSDNVPGLRFVPVWRYGFSVGLDYKF